MNVSSIKNYDSEFCGSLPLGFINSIQPHGILFIISNSDQAILQVSENIETLGISPSEIIHRNFTDFIDTSSLENYKQKVSNHEIHGYISLNLLLKINGSVKSFPTLIHFKQDLLFVELQLIENPSQPFSEVFQDIKYFMAAIGSAKEIADVAKVAAKEIKKISGFDKVMIYSFDEQWNGTVIAEEMEQDMDSYLHLRFPASDVPRQARELYKKNPYRLVPDVNYSPVKLYPVINPTTHAFVDLSDSTLRSVPAVHVEYLKNMKVYASMSVRIIKDDKLWGLITCHHKKPKKVDFQLCSIFELLSTVVSARISGLENEKEFTFRQKLGNISMKIIENLYNEENFIHTLLIKSPGLLELLDLNGAAIIYNRQIKTLGTTPSEKDLESLADYLFRNRIETTYSTTSISQEFEPALAYSELASGMIAIPISPRRGEYIIGFKPEVVQTVNWGGNPNEAIQFESDQKTYHPRNSFTIWKETVKNNSLPWKEAELEAAENLRKSILESIVREKI